MKIIIPGIFRRFDNIVAGVSTKDGGVSPAPFFMNLSYKVGDVTENVNKNREIFFKALGIPLKRVTYQKQIHSSNSNYVSTPSFFKDSDALYTDLKNNFLAVSIADCIPVLLYEPGKKIISAVHSGWKGTCNKILTKNINLLIEKFNLDTKNLCAYIGPGISQKNFEVGKEVADLFSDSVKICRDGKYFIDLKKDNFMQLISLGVKEENIEVSPYCTYEESDLLHSYRRDGDKSGRMLCVIGMI
jgi:YfiH family protein